MEENKEKLVFSSVTSENLKQEMPNPQAVVNQAFKEEQLRQTGEIPVDKIKQAASVNQSSSVVVPDEKLNSQPQISQPIQNQQPKQKLIDRLSTLEATKVFDIKIPYTIPTSNDEAPTDQKTEQKTKVKIKTHMKKNAKIVISLLILIIIISIILVRGYLYINNPKNISKKAILSLGEEISSLIDINDQLTLLGDNFSKETIITTSLESQKVEEEHTTDSKMAEYYYLLNNLNNSKTTIALKQNLQTKQLFYNRQTIYNNKLIINDKYLIENSTEYYFVKDFFEKYINDGNNNYFETITKDKNVIYNIKYLYKIILENIADCIDENEYNISNTTTFLNNETESVKKITIKLDNTKIRKILNKTLEVLKKDKEAFNILNGLIENFTDYEIPSKIKFLDTNEILTISLYTKGILNDIKKYEINLTNRNESKELTYEINNNLITIIKNNNVKYYLNYIKKNNLIINIKNKDNKQVGTIELDKTQERTHFTMDYDDSEYDIDIDFNYKVSNRKNNSYNSDITTNINIEQNGKIILGGKITTESVITDEAEIKEDTNDVIFSKEITKEKENELKSLFETRLKKNLN